MRSSRGSGRHVRLAVLVGLVAGGLGSGCGGDAMRGGPSDEGQGGAGSGGRRASGGRGGQGGQVQNAGNGGSSVSEPDAGMVAPPPPDAGTPIGVGAPPV